MVKVSSDVFLFNYDQMTLLHQVWLSENGRPKAELLELVLPSGGTYNYVNVAPVIDR